MGHRRDGRDKGSVAHVLYHPMFRETHLPSQRDPLTQMSQLGEEAGARAGVSLGFENYSM